MKTLIRSAAAALSAAALCWNIYVELAPWYVVRAETKIMFAAAIIILSGTAFFFGLPRNVRKRRHRKYIRLLFWYYLWVLANVLFFDNAFGRGFTPHPSLLAVNLEPFRTIRNYIIAYKYHNISLRLVILNLAGNLAAFAPMGFFLPALHRWQRSIFFFTATLILGITTVEVAQIYTGAGSCDIDDLILNLTGALFVFIVCRVTPLWRHICAVTPRPPINKQRDTPDT